MSIESLLEFTTAGGKVEGNVVRGVKILGMESKNGRRYRPAAMRNAIGMYEGVKVNINHPKAPGESRAYQDRFGSFQQVHFREGSGLHGDFHFNPHHPIAAQFKWDCENAPNVAGFSHNVDARTSRENGKIVIEEIAHVRSVDLVADPATTNGFFESENNELASMTLQELIAARPDIVAKVREEHEQQQREQIAALEAEVATRRASKIAEEERERAKYNRGKYADHRCLTEAAEMFNAFPGLAQQTSTRSSLRQLLNLRDSDLGAFLSEHDIKPLDKYHADPSYSMKQVHEAVMSTVGKGPKALQDFVARLKGKATHTPAEVKEFTESLLTGRRWN